MLTAATRTAALRISASVLDLAFAKVSSVLIGNGSGRGDQTIADAAHRLQKQRIGGIALDLAPETIDLHIDGALVHAALAGERATRHRLARYYRKDAQHLALAVGEMDDFLALAQFT